MPDLNTNYDGLLLCGGNDISPSHYGQESNGAHSLDKGRDESEFELTRKFIDTGKPILRICRGIQLLNVVLGGTLIQDLPSANFHRAHGEADSVHSVEAKGILARLYKENFSANSAHHQGVGALGVGLCATAWCNGVVEAIEHTEKPYFAVQFPPKRLCLAHKRNNTVNGLLIFECFVDLCKKE